MYTYYNCQSFRTLNHWQSVGRKEDSTSAWDLILTHEGITDIVIDGVPYYIIGGYKPAGYVEEKRIDDASASVPARWLYYRVPYKIQRTEYQAHGEKNDWTYNGGVFYLGTQQYNFTPVTWVPGSTADAKYLALPFHKPGDVSTKIEWTHSADYRYNIVVPEMSIYMVVTAWRKAGSEWNFPEWLDNTNTADISNSAFTGSAISNEGRAGTKFVYDNLNLTTTLSNWDFLKNIKVRYPKGGIFNVSQGNGVDKIGRSPCAGSEGFNTTQGVDVEADTMQAIADASTISDSGTRWTSGFRGGYTSNIVDYGNRFDPNGITWSTEDYTYGGATAKIESTIRSNINFVGAGNKKIEELLHVSTVPYQGRYRRPNFSIQTDMITGNEGQSYVICAGVFAIPTRFKAYKNVQIATIGAEI